jgi:hypothetical protein
MMSISRTCFTISGRAFSSSGSLAWSVFTSSMIKATVVLKCHRFSKSAETRRSVWCALRRRTFSFSDAEPGFG